MHTTSLSFIREFHCYFSRITIHNCLRVRDLPFFGGNSAFGQGHCNVQETQLLGYRIPKRSLILLNIWACHRNARDWKYPDEFRPENFLDENNKVHIPDAFLAFSTGEKILSPNSEWVLMNEGFNVQLFLSQARELVPHGRWRQWWCLCWWPICFKNSSLSIPVVKNCPVCISTFPDVPPVSRHTRSKLSLGIDMLYYTVKHRLCSVYTYFPLRFIIYLSFHT